MYGSIIGDIIGSPYEFNNHLSKNFTLFTRKSFFTDDTIMTLAIAKGIYDFKTNHTPLNQSILNNVLDFGSRYPDADYGSRFRYFLISPTPYNSFGNGAAMRISYAGEIASTLKEAKELSYAATAISHNHVEGLKGAECIATCIYLAKHGYTLSQLKQYALTYYPDISTLSCAALQGHYYFDETCQGTIPQALTCLFESTSFEDAIRNAISIGGDSDTIAAIVGSIAEQIYPIPQWIKAEAERYLDDYLLQTLKTVISIL